MTEKEQRVVTRTFACPMRCCSTQVRGTPPSVAVAEHAGRHRARPLQHVVRAALRRPRYQHRRRTARRNRTSKANRLRVWLSANSSEAATALLALADYIEAMKTRLSSQRSTCLMNNYSACAISLGTFGQPHLRWHLAASGSALAVAPGPSTRAPDTVRVLP